VSGGGVVVTGGADGIAAHVEDLLGLAALLRTTGTELDDELADLGATGFEWALLTTGSVDPAGAAAIRADRSALAGLLRGSAAHSAFLAFELVAAAASYEAAEQRVGTSFLQRLGETLWSVGSPVPPDLVAAVTHVPESELSPLNAVPRGLARVLPDGHAVLHDLGTDYGAAGVLPPRALSDLIIDLSARNQGRPGEISVSVVAGADGRRRAIVDIPGTKSWIPAPVPDVTSVGTDVIAIAGRTTSYERGIFAALDDAGIDAHTDVMLVGHSEGGIVAVDAARDAATSGRYRITHVVTAGSPVGVLAKDLPADVQLLSLENDADIVPRLDGAPNPDRPNVTTVRVDNDHGSVGANHDLDESYLPEATDAQTAGSASVAAFLASARGFLDGRSMSTHAYQITRGA
jgi:hypothetical protein